MANESQERPRPFLPSFLRRSIPPLERDESNEGALRATRRLFGLRRRDQNATFGDLVEGARVRREGETPVRLPARPADLSAHSDSISPIHQSISPYLRMRIAVAHAFSRDRPFLQPSRQFASSPFAALARRPRRTNMLNRVSERFGIKPRLALAPT